MARMKMAGLEVRECHEDLWRMMKGSSAVVVGCGSDSNEF
jgi:hypothetical protein